MAEEQKPARVKLSGIWENKTRDGKSFFTGQLGDARVEIWPNKYKTEDKHPDYVMYLSEPQKRENTNTNTGFGNNNNRRQSTTEDFPF